MFIGFFFEYIVECIVEDEDALRAEQHFIPRWRAFESFPVASQPVSKWTRSLLYCMSVAISGIEISAVLSSSSSASSSSSVALTRLSTAPAVVDCVVRSDRSECDCPPAHQSLHNNVSTDESNVKIVSCTAIRLLSRQSCHSVAGRSWLAGYILTSST